MFLAKLVLCPKICFGLFADKFDGRRVGKSKQDLVAEGFSVQYSSTAKKTICVNISATYRKPYAELVNKAYIRRCPLSRKEPN